MRENGEIHLTANYIVPILTKNEILSLFFRKKVTHLNLFSFFFSIKKGVNEFLTVSMHILLI